MSARLPDHVVTNDSAKMLWEDSMCYNSNSWSSVSVKRKKKADASTCCRVSQCWPSTIIADVRPVVRRGVFGWFHLPFGEYLSRLARLRTANVRHSSSKTRRGSDSVSFALDDCGQRRQSNLGNNLIMYYEIVQVLTLRSWSTSCGIVKSCWSITLNCENWINELINQ